MLVAVAGLLVAVAGLLVTVVVLVVVGITPTAIDAADTAGVVVVVVLEIDDNISVARLYTFDACWYRHCDDKLSPV